VVSGGHTQLYLCPEEGVYRTLARSRDDAAGEAFDKVARLTGLGYPGGPVIDRLSEGAERARYDFPRAVMKTARSTSPSAASRRRCGDSRRRKVSRVTAGERRPLRRRRAVRDLVASFQRAVVEALVDTTLRACRARASPHVILSAGGVACNRRLRRAFAEAAARGGAIGLHPVTQVHDRQRRHDRRRPRSFISSAATPPARPRCRSQPAL
jgi:N6-L-threonylcarbamoyladenine synthase